MMATRREVYARNSPVVWRPRRGITEQHARFLERQGRIRIPSRCGPGHAFIIAQCRDREGFIDDFAVDGEGTWTGDGRELFTAAWICCPLAELGARSAPTFLMSRCLQQCSDTANVRRTGWERSS
jgi:hypothetical protein